MTAQVNVTGQPGYYAPPPAPGAQVYVSSPQMYVAAPQPVVVANPQPVMVVSVSFPERW